MVRNQALTTDKFRFWINWLKTVNFIIVFIGILIAFFGDSILFDFHNSGTQDVFFNGNSLPGETLRLKNWLFGIIGATIAGFHILIMYVIIYPLSNQEKWARNSLFFGISVWFLIDTSISLYFGAFYNIYFINIPSYLLVLLPLIFIWKCFKE